MIMKISVREYVTSALCDRRRIDILAEENQFCLHELSFLYIPMTTTRSQDISRERSKERKEKQRERIDHSRCSNMNKETCSNLDNEREEEWSKNTHKGVLVIVLPSGMLISECSIVKRGK